MNILWVYLSIYAFWIIASFLFAKVKYDKQDAEFKTISDVWAHGVVFGFAIGTIWPLIFLGWVISETSKIILHLMVKYVK